MGVEMKTIHAAALAATVLASASASQAGVIIQPKAVTVNIGGELLNFPAFNMINQSGLSEKYKSGVTNFDEYVGGKPKHSADAGEWLSTGPLSMATVTFDLGEVYEFNGVAIWNEDASSLSTIIARIPFLGSYSAFGFADARSDLGVAYGPTVSRHQNITSRYVTFDLYGCNRSGFAHNGCGLGEVAFRSTKDAPAGVPEPATWAMMILGFGGIGAAMRGRRLALA